MTSDEVENLKELIAAARTVRECVDPCCTCYEGWHIKDGERLQNALNRFDELVHRPDDQYIESEVQAQEDREADNDFRCQAMEDDKEQLRKLPWLRISE